MNSPDLWLLLVNVRSVQGDAVQAMGLEDLLSGTRHFLADRLKAGNGASLVESLLACVDYWVASQP